MAARGGMNQSMAAVQMRIRQNAMEMQDTLKSLSRWEAQAKTKEKKVVAQAQSAARKRRQNKNKRAAGRGGGNRIPAVRGSVGSRVVAASSAPSSSSSSSGAAAAAHPMLRGRLPEGDGGEQKNGSGDPNSTKAAHTYDKGYKKWEAFDVESELAKIDQADDLADVETSTPPPPAAAAAAADDDDDDDDSDGLDMDSLLDDVLGESSDGETDPQTAPAAAPAFPPLWHLYTHAQKLSR